MADFSDDGYPGMAASLAYYSTFSLPSLLILIVLIVGAAWGTTEVERQIEEQFGALVGEPGARQIGTIIRQANRPGRGGALTAVASIIALLFGATGASAQLQTALNRAWEVKPDPERGGVRNFLMKRMLSFGMILAIAFLLLVSLAVSALLGAAGDYVQGLLPGLSGHLLWTFNELVSLAVITVLFAAIFKWMPDAVIAWRDVWAGAVVTAVLLGAEYTKPSPPDRPETGRRQARAFSRSRISASSSSWVGFFGSGSAGFSSSRCSSRL